MDFTIILTLIIVFLYLIDPLSLAERWVQVEAGFGQVEIRFRNRFKFDSSIFMTQMVTQ